MSETAATVPLAPEVFLINPFAIDINSLMPEGSKLHLKAIEPLLRANRVNILLETGYLVHRYFETYCSKFTWGILLSQVLDNNITK